MEFFERRAGEEGFGERGQPAVAGPENPQGGQVGEVVREGGERFGEADVELFERREGG